MPLKTNRPQPAFQGGGWQPAKVKLFLEPEGSTKTKTVEAEVYGAFSVYPATSSLQQGQWTLGHVPTGRKILTLPVKEDLQRVARYLWRKCCLIFREQTQEAVVAKLPDWVRTWRDDMVVAGAYLDPPEGGTP